MDKYFWYLIFNQSDFEDTDIVSRTYEVNLEGIGNKDIVATKQNLLGITYDGVYLPVDLLDSAPFELDGVASFINENGDVYLGVPK